MRNLLAILAAVFLAAATLGGVRGWYAVELLTADAGKTAFRVEIDRTKVGSDFIEAGRSVQRLVNGENAQTKAK